MARNKSEATQEKPASMECPSCDYVDEFYYVEAGESVYHVSFEGGTLVVDKSAPIEEDIDVAGFECSACGHKFESPPGREVRFDY